MPYVYEEPEQFMNYLDVEIYHCYKEDTDCKLEYWYAVSSTEEEEYQFDVRSLPTYHPDVSHEGVIRNAIEAGLLRAFEPVKEDYR